MRRNSNTTPRTISVNVATKKKKKTQQLPEPPQISRNDPELKVASGLTYEVEMLHRTFDEVSSALSALEDTLSPLLLPLQAAEESAERPVVTEEYSVLHSQVASAGFRFRSLTERIDFLRHRIDL